MDAFIQSMNNSIVQERERTEPKENPNDAFSFTESFIEGDATPSATTVTGGIVTALPILGSTTTTSGGVAGSLAGTIATDGALTITAGGAGTQAVGQVIQELTIK